MYFLDDTVLFPDRDQNVLVANDNESSYLFVDNFCVGPYGGKSYKSFEITKLIDEKWSSLISGFGGDPS